MPTAQAKKFVASLPPEDSELVICPPSCREVHDEKWHGVTVPMPKKVEAPVQSHNIELFRHTPPKDTVVWEDPYPTLEMKEWRKAMLRDGLSPWKHYEYETTGTIAPMTPPTTKQLEKHARMYGVKSSATLASCIEVANMYGVTARIPKPPPVRKGPRGMSVEEKARQLVDLGHSWNLVEEELDLSRPKSIELKELVLGVGAA